MDFAKRIGDLKADARAFVVRQRQHLLEQPRLAIQTRFRQSHAVFSQGKVRIAERGFEISRPGVRPGPSGPTAR